MKNPFDYELHNNRIHLVVVDTECFISMPSSFSGIALCHWNTNTYCVPNGHDGDDDKSKKYQETHCAVYAILYSIRPLFYTKQRHSSTQTFTSFHFDYSWRFLQHYPLQLEMTLMHITIYGLYYTQFISMKFKLCQFSAEHAYFFLLKSMKHFDEKKCKWFFFHSFYVAFANDPFCLLMIF